MMFYNYDWGTTAQIFNNPFWAVLCMVFMFFVWWLPFLGVLALVKYLFLGHHHGCGKSGGCCKEESNCCEEEGHEGKKM